MATKPSLALIPSGVATNKVFSVLPSNGDGDFDFARTGTATRINKDGLIETVGANIPRLDYSNGGCPSLLLEPERTNLCQNYKDFDRAADPQTNWYEEGVTVSQNEIISPDGSLNASRFTSTGGDTRITNYYPAVFADEHTVSIYAKLDTSSETTAVRLQTFNGSIGITSSFNLSTGEIVGNYTNSFIESLGNDWYRIGGTYTSVVGEQVLYVYPSSSYGITGTAYFWGCQVERGNYASSIIPTKYAIATRYNDNCNRINIENYIGQTEGTLFLDFEYLMDVGTDPENDSLRDIIYFGGTPDQNEIPTLLSTLQARATYYENANGTTEILEKLQGSILGGYITVDNYRSQFRVYVRGSNMNDVALGLDVSGSALANTRYKLAIKYKSGDFKCYRNGILIGSNTGILNFASPLNSLFFSWYNRAFDNQKRVNNLRIYKTGLTDQELIELTTI